MTDLEVVELALRRLAIDTESSPIGYWFLQLANEILKIKQGQNEPSK
jgi:hypothetical protein